MGRSPNDVKNILRSMGIPVNVRNTPKDLQHSWTFCDLFAGATIAPNILQKMSRDEEYFQEIKREMHDWFFVEAPKFERTERMRVGCRGDDIRVLTGMSIDENGEIVRWAVALWNDDVEKDKPAESQARRRGFNNTLNVAHSYSAYASKFAALAGDIHLRPQNNNN